MKYIWKKCPKIEWKRLKDPIWYVCVITDIRDIWHHVKIIYVKKCVGYMYIFIQTCGIDKL